MKKVIALAVIGISAVAVFNLPIGSHPDWVLPNSKVTPGATNPNVNQSNINQTICVSGWTATIRPSSAYTTNLKINQLNGDYNGFKAIFGDSTASYEEDHLISLELGGSPTDAKNLWTQPYIGKNAHMKDLIENRLNNLVCSGQITLKDAQNQIAKNWVKAYNKYIKG